MARVKICGIRSLADMQIAVQQSADNTGSAGHHLVERRQETGDGTLADEKPFG